METNTSEQRENIASKLDKKPIEVNQNPYKKYQLLIGIFLGIICLFLIISNSSYLRSAVWFLSIPLGSLIIASIVQLCLRIFLSPQKMVINDNVISIYMFFNRQPEIFINEIEEIVSKKSFKPFVEHGGWLICPSRKLKIFIAKSFYYLSSFDEFIATIKERNPRCKIDQTILDWKGPYSGI